MHKDRDFMKKALSLARRGEGRVSPNPMVGAVIVKNGGIIGRGYHRRFGAPHAEVVALEEAGDSARGGTLYLNLEPCTHFGKTPPCVDEIIKKGIKEVVVAMKDPNPINNGKGIRILRKAGIKVKVGVLAEEAIRLNETFIKWVRKGIPFVSIKVAQTLDGKIATKSGRSRWITGPEAGGFVHCLRAVSDCIIVGANTVLKDNPLLTARPKERSDFNQPLRVILDSKLRIPFNANVYNGKARTLIATTTDAPIRKAERFKKRGVEVLAFRPRKGKVSLRVLLKRLAWRGIASVLVEGGGETIASFLEERLADKVYIFIAPKIIGGRNSITSCEGKGVDILSRAHRLNNLSIKKIGCDILIAGYVKN